MNVNEICRCYHRTTVSDFINIYLPRARTHTLVYYFINESVANE